MTLNVIHGEAIAEMQRMETGRFEVCVTSPPYNIGIDYDAYDDNIGDYNEWTLAWLREATRVSRKGVMLNIDSKPSSQTNLFATLGAIASEFVVQNTIVWVKSICVDGTTTGHVKPMQGTRYLNHAHEFVLHITPKVVDIDRLAVGVPYADKSNIARFKGSNDRDLRCGGTTWFVPYATKQSKDAHPAAFPVALAERMIRYAGGDGEVLDPFCGSGTTLLAAKQLGRSATGIELSDTYAAMTQRRVA